MTRRPEVQFPWLDRGQVEALMQIVILYQTLYMLLPILQKQLLMFVPSISRGLPSINMMLIS